jgi:peptide/nickel transport system permease protein
MLATLLIVSALVFAFSEVLPGDIGRVILGRYATPAQVKALDHKLGVDQPVWERYPHWLKRFVAGDWGISQLLGTPVRSLVADRLANSLLLALVAIIFTVPLSLCMGVLAGLREGGVVDRIVSIVGVSLTVIPEFVSGVILIAIFAVALRWLPVTGQAPPGAGLPTRLHYLVLPALPLTVVLFGYIARMARAGTLDVVESPYYRTAVLKGLPRRRVVVHHVLRNALPPAITVVAAQVGYLVGGLVVIEDLFNYPGIGKLLLDSAIGHDVPVLETSTLTVGTIIMVGTLLADLSYGLLVPRIRLATR